jgi:PIN domain nuclease of toxin-antitoxin system
MSDRCVVDTHALVWFLEGNPRLGPGAKAALGDPGSELFIPLIALAEACWMVEHGRSSITDVSAFLAAVDADPRTVVIPLNRAVLERSLPLTGINEMHGRQIVATALELAADGPIVLLTRDDDIRDSALIPVVW